MQATHRQVTKALQARIRAERTASLVVNTRARRGDALYVQARDLLLANGMKLDSTYPVRDPGRVPEIVKELVARGMPLVIVGGGDGTISSIVDEFAHRDAVLGILPLGTANSFARTLGLPVTVEGAVEVIAHGKVADVDLGKLNDDYFANAATLGLSSAIAHSRLYTLKRYLGRASYPIVGAIKFFSHKNFGCTLANGARSTTVKAFEVLIANGRYQGGTLVAPEASLESRDLVIRIIKGESKWRLLKAWTMTVLGAPPDHRLIELHRVTDVTIATDPSQYVAIDGEIVLRTPIRACVAPDALRLTVPNEFKERESG